MQLTSKQFGSARVLKLAGRIDHDNAEDFKAALQPYLSQCEAGGALVLDFSDVTYISSAGFRVLLLAQRHASSLKCALATCGAQAVVMEIFAISKFDKVISCHGSVRDALAKHAPASLAAFDG